MELSDAASAFGALSQESRLKVLQTLITAGPTGMNAGDLADHLAIPASTLSFHLAALERNGLTRSTKQGRQIIYAARIAGLRELLSFMAQTCGDARPELCDVPTLLAQEEATMTATFNVLFVCTHNSARSIMAEAILKKIGARRFHAYSAGSRPATKPMLEVLEKLRSLGHEVTDLRAKSWNEFTRPHSPRMDFVIALCDTIDTRSCPDVGEPVVVGAWPLPDPAKFTGNSIQRSLLLNELYAGIRRRIEIFTSLPFAKLDRVAAKARLDELATTGLSVMFRSQAG